MVHEVFNDAFEALLAGWHRHMDLVASTDNVLKLAESRRQLDFLQKQAHRHQETPDDRLAAYCPFLSTPVSIPRSRVEYSADQVVAFHCRCKRRVIHHPQTRAEYRRPHSLRLVTS